MAESVSDKQFKALVAEVKKNPGMSERHYAEATGIPASQIGAALWKAEPVADPSLKIKATGAAIANARDKEGIRWPRIAARTGLSVAEVKAAYQTHTGNDPSKSYTGRGRNHANGGGTTTRKSSGAGRKTGGTGRGTSGRRAAAKTATAGRKTKTAGRSRTRADRAVSSGDPQ